jgi:predicted lysophospholipase L1 biosynthesis ABC-type transport system permease subunit
MTKITAEHLSRSAIVYVRQSTFYQVMNNLESGRRQYGLVERARQLGRSDVQVIDEDLGRSGSGGTAWLIACSNVAGLLLARVAARRTEIAVRSALGATRRRMVARFLTESLLLSIAAATGGLGLADLILHIFRHKLATMLPMAQNIHLDWTIFAGLVVLTLLTTLAFGTVPALLAAWAGANAGSRNSCRTDPIQLFLWWAPDSLAENNSRHVFNWRFLIVVLG